MDGQKIRFQKAAWLLVVIAATLTSCRFGNRRVETLPQDGPNNRQSQAAGFYEAEFTKVSVCPTFANGDGPCGETDISFAPVFFTGTLRGPIGYDPQTQDQGVMFSVYTPKEGWMLDIDPENPRNFYKQAISNSTSKFWEDSACQLGMGMMIKGGAVPYADGSTNPFKLPSGANSVLSGRLQMELVLALAYEGACDPSFASALRCHTDVDQCPGTDGGEKEGAQNYAKLLFGNLPEILTAEDLSRVVGIRYHLEVK